jgi:hypothetical protein
MFDHDYLTGVNFFRPLILPVYLLAILLRLGNVGDSPSHMAKAVPQLGFVLNEPFIKM